MKKFRKYLGIAYITIGVLSSITVLSGTFLHDAESVGVLDDVYHLARYIALFYVGMVSATLFYETVLKIGMEIIGNKEE